MALITVTPKAKIVTGIALSGASVLGFYKTYKADKKDKFAYGIVSGLVLVGGLLLARKGYLQNKSLRVMPQEVTPSDEAKKIIAEAVKEGKVSSNASGELETVTAPAPATTVNRQPVSAPTRPASSVPSRPVAQQQKPNAVPQSQTQQQWQNGRVVGKVDMKNVEASKARKDKIFAHIGQLKAKHDALKKEKGGWQKGLPIRNEIEILKAQLHWA